MWAEHHSIHSMRERSSLLSWKSLAAVTLQGEGLKESPGRNRFKAIGKGPPHWLALGAGVPWQSCLWERHQRRRWSQKPGEGEQLKVRGEALGGVLQPRACLPKAFL